jgi:hypothetical protein
VRDKEGRIYVDLKEEWLRPFLQSLRFSVLDMPFIPVHNVLSNRCIEQFNDNEFVFPSSKLVGHVDYQNIRWDDPEIFKSFLDPVANHADILLKPLWMELTKENRNTFNYNNLRYKTLLYLFEHEDKDYAVIRQHSSRP